MEAPFIVGLGLLTHHMTRSKSIDCVKSVQIRIEYVFGLNTGKYGPEKLRIWTLFTQYW